MIRSASTNFIAKTVRAGREREPKIIAESRIGSAGLFATLHVPLLAGEMCPEESNTPGMMVNRSFANTYFGGAGVIGKHLGQPISLYFPSALVRGIVGDTRERGLARSVERTSPVKQRQNREFRPVI